MDQNVLRDVGEGWDNWFDVTLKYVLPTGDAKEKAVSSGRGVQQILLPRERALYPPAGPGAQRLDRILADLRLIPDWNPLGDWKLLRIFDIDWWQFAPFFEIDRVAPEWDVGDLHSDMMWDAGLGVRLMVMKSVVRLDVAVPDETTGIWAMVGHPF